MAKEEFTDAIALLKADHRKAEELFEKFETAKGAKKQQIAEQVCNELKVHTLLEEEIFYPGLKGKIEDTDMLNEAYVEHDAAKMLINDILSGNPDDEYFDAKVTVLGEAVQHHIEEEEAAKEGLFAQARKADVDLKAMRDQMLIRKEELMKQVKAGGLPPAQIQTINQAA